jgi:ferrous iron transport protein A
MLEVLKFRCFESRMASAQTLIPLAELPIGASGRISEVRAGRRLTRRMLALGLRVGSEVRVLHHLGGGLVVSHGETRVALGGGIVDKLWVEPLPQVANVPSRDQSRSGTRE